MTFHAIKQRFFSRSLSFPSPSPSSGGTIDMYSSYNPYDDDDYNDDYDNYDEEEENSHIESLNAYSYLDDSPLHTLFDMCHDTEPGKTFKVYLYLYQINSSCSLPFIESIFIEQGNTMCFPSFDYHCIHLEDSEESDEDTQTNIHFNNSCMESILPFLQEGEQPNRMIYKGFLSYNETTLFAVFDLTEQPIKPNSIGIMDEIINKQSILGISIDPIIHDFFTKFSFMKYILSGSGSHIDMPIQLYIYNMTTNTNNGIFIQKDNSELGELLGKINERSTSSWFGSFYYFSREPITPTKRRHAVFLSDLHDSLYIVRDINTIDENIKNDYRERCYHSPMIYFMKDGIEMYCIKSFTQFCEIEGETPSNTPI
jgi:hypothetical protein